MLATAATTPPTTPGSGKIVDDEVQKYVLTTVSPAAAVTEDNLAISLDLRAILLGPRWKKS